MAGAGFGFGSGMAQGMQSRQQAQQFGDMASAFRGKEVDIDKLRGIWHPDVQQMAWQMLMQRKGGRFGALPGSYQFLTPQQQQQAALQSAGLRQAPTTLTPEETRRRDLIAAGIQPRAQAQAVPTRASAQGKEIARLQAIKNRTPEQQKRLDSLLIPGPGVTVNLGEKAITNTLALRREFQADRRVKNYQIIDRSEKALRAALEQSRIPGKSRIASDQALGVMFQKMLDPDSVVRESEYARTPEGAGIISRLKSWIPKLSRGGLAIGDKDRQALVDMAQKLLEESKRTFNQAYDEYATTAGEFGFNQKAIFGGAKKFGMSAEPTFEQIEAELKRRGVQ